VKNVASVDKRSFSSATELLELGRRVGEAVQPAQGDLPAPNRNRVSNDEIMARGQAKESDELEKTQSLFPGSLCDEGKFLLGHPVPEP
jgi:hypothetical protein